MAAMCAVIGAHLAVQENSAETAKEMGRPVVMKGAQATQANLEKIISQPRFASGELTGARERRRNEAAAHAILATAERQRGLKRHRRYDTNNSLQRTPNPGDTKRRNWGKRM